MVYIPENFLLLPEARLVVNGGTFNTGVGSSLQLLWRNLFVSGKRAALDRWVRHANGKFHEYVSTQTSINVIT